MMTANDHVLDGNAKRADDTSSLNTTGSSEGYAESIERELAEAKAENAQLRADLENERSQKVSTNSQDDPLRRVKAKRLCGRASI
jgi:hypothetical protein